MRLFGPPGGGQDAPDCRPGLRADRARLPVLFARTSKLVQRLQAALRISATAD